MTPHEKSRLDWLHANEPDTPMRDKAKIVGVDPQAARHYLTRGKSVSLSLATPPSSNHLFANVPGRGRVVSREYSKWRKAAASEIAVYAIATLTKPYGVHIRADVDHRRDIDNLAKPILDALVASGVIIGDQWVNSVRIERDRTVRGCSVEVWEI